MLKKSLSVLEYVVFISMLVISVAIGIYFRFSGGKQKTVDEILYGNRQNSFVPVAFSIMATSISAIGMLGLSAESYLFGVQMSALSLSYILALPVIIFFYQPMFFKLEARSVYQYLANRFGNATKTVASISYMVQTVVFLSIVLHAPSLALSTMMGVAKWSSIILVGSVCTFYCFLGGMKAVLWTDVIQSLLMYGSIISIIVTGSLNHKNFWSIVSASGRSQFFNFSLDPTLRYSFWSLVIGGFFLALFNNAAYQTLVQRMVCVKTLAQSRWAVTLGIFLTVLQIVGVSFCGVIIYAEFADCDPLTGNIIKSADQILPYYVMTTLGNIPGLSGMCLAGILSASLSTMSSGINSQAAVTLVDFITPLMSKPLTESKAAFITKLLILFYGTICVVFNYFVDHLGSSVLEASAVITGIIGGPLLGLFTLGMLFKCSNQKGALTGFFVAVAVCLWIGLGSKYSGMRIKPLPLSTQSCDNFTLPGVEQNINTDDNILWIYRISYMWYAMIGCLLVVFVGLVISVLTDCTSSAQDISMLSSVLNTVRRPKKRCVHRNDLQPNDILRLEPLTRRQSLQTDNN